MKKICPSHLQHSRCWEVDSGGLERKNGMVGGRGWKSGGRMNRGRGDVRCRGGRWEWDGRR